MLRERLNGTEERIKVFSAGFHPAELRELLAAKGVKPPEHLYGVSMSGPTLEELGKRGVTPPEGWRSKELAADDVGNSDLIIVALMEQKQEMLTLYPEGIGKVFTTREIGGQEKPLTHEVFSLLPFDETFWSFCEEDPDYVGQVLSEVEEVLIRGFPTILHHLGF
jgi:protein-tyrosine-phosphatase